MQKLLGDILIEKGYIKTGDLNRALLYQMRKIVGEDSPVSADAAETFILEIARTKYNRRDEFYLGRILTELNLLPEISVQEALEIQKSSQQDKPQGKLDALRRISLRINGSYNLIDLLAQILVFAAQLVEAESASLIVHDIVTDSLVILMPTGPGADAVRELAIPRGRGIAGWVYDNSRPVIANDARHDRRFYPAIDRVSGCATRQVICVPLSVKDKRLGVIEAVNKKQGPSARFGLADQFLLELFSAQAAIAIENTRLALALARSQEELDLRASMAAQSAGQRVSTQLCDSFLHQLSDSLVPLKGYAGRLSEAARDPRIEKYGSYLDAAMARLMRNAESALRFVRNELPLRPEAVILSDILRDLEARTWVECRLSGIAFEVDSNAHVKLNADREALLYALETLFQNSREAMPEGGTFRVGSMPQENDTIMLRVLDTGTGILGDAIARLFEPFFTFGKLHGAGLGLCVARQIIEAHGGSLSVGNRTDRRGAQATIRLPVLTS